VKKGGGGVLPKKSKMDQNGCNATVGESEPFTVKKKKNQKNGLFSRLSREHDFGKGKPKGALG